MKHIITIAIMALIVTAIIGCGGSPKQEDTSWFSFGKKEKVEESAFKNLEMKFEDLKAQMSGGKTSNEKANERAEFWQAVAAVLVVIAGFALVFGAALGSQARRIHRVSAHTTNPDHSTK